MINLKRAISIILLSSLAAGAGGCLQPPQYYADEVEEPTVFMNIQEAEQIALYLEDDVILNRFMLKRVFYDITLIRGAFGKDIPALDEIRFRPPCKDGRVVITFDAETYPEVIAGKYTDWNEINDRYQPYDVRAIDELRKIYLFFDGLIDLRALASRYAELPGVSSAECVGHLTDSPNIYPRRTDTGIDYLFRDAWSSCSTGCKNNEFFYFVCENDDAVYVGSWNPGDRSNPPDWWQSARKCLPAELRERF
jgi:hypothetical protein